MRPFIYNSLWGTYAPLMLFFGYSLYITAMDPAYIHRLEQLRPNPWTQFLTPQNKELITAHEYKNYVMPKEENMLPLLDKYKTYAPITFLKGAGKTDIQHWESKGTRFVVDVRSAEAQLRLRRSYTPGWSATDEGKPITLKPTNPEGFIEMTLPKGIHSIKMTYVPNNYPIAKYISLASLAGLLLCCAINRKTKRKI